MDIVPDVVHEVLVDLGCAVQHPPFLPEDVNGNDGQCQQDQHQPATFDGHFDEGIGLLGLSDLGNRSGSGGGSVGRRIDTCL